MNPENAQQAVALIKFFSDENHYLAFKRGTSIFRTPHFYRQHESSGRGDRAESCLGYWDKRLGDDLPDIILDGREIDTKNAESLLVYPAHEQQDAWLQSWCVIGPHNRFEQSLEQMLAEFGTYFVVMPATKVSEYVKLLIQASGLQVRVGLVGYSEDPLDRSLTVKDAKFRYQKELRFFMGQCEKGELQDKELQLQGLEELLLEAASLRLRSPSGKTKYCSLGRREVVVVD